MAKQRYHDLRRDDMRLPHKAKPLLTSSFARKVGALCLIVLLGVLLLDHQDGQTVYARLSALHRPTLNWIERQGSVTEPTAQPIAMAGWKSRTQTRAQFLLKHQTLNRLGAAKSILGYAQAPEDTSLNWTP